MDWAAFFRDYGQSLFTLGGVFLGSVITFLINWLNLRNQSIERDKDRNEQRREAKAQLALELMHKDIKLVDDTILVALGIMDTLKLARARARLGVLPMENLRAEMESILGSQTSKLSKLEELDTMTELLAFTFGDEIYSEYENFTRLYGNATAVLLDPHSSSKDEEAVNQQIIRSAGRLRLMMIEKLKSLRDFG
jgi:hypothetical protein